MPVNNLQYIVPSFIPFDSPTTLPCKLGKPVSVPFYMDKETDTARC